MLRVMKTLMQEAFASSPLRDAVLKTALGEVGVCEDPPGSNRGRRVEEYLRSVYTGAGNAWCAAFVYWCYEQASAGLNRVNPLVRTAGCMQHWLHTKGLKTTAAEALHDPSLIHSGAVFIISRGGGKGHTGIVTGVFEDCIETIEGNSNADHSAEGGSVCRLRRKLEEVNVGFILYC
jgi:hypothetical protein